MKTSSESPEEVEARQLFERALGLKVTRLAGDHSKTPDFLVDGELPGYVVEVKTRFDDEDYMFELESGAPVLRDCSFGHDRWGEDVARKARKQLQAGDPDSARFWVLYIAVKARSSPKTIFQQIISTLYGMRQVASCDAAGNSWGMRSCLFAVPGVFERWPSIVAAIVTEGDGITLCANEFSDNATRFRSSSLYRMFADRGGVEAPSQMTTERGFLSVDGSAVDRKDESAVCAYLSHRYGLVGVHVLDMKEYSASMLVRKGE